MLINYVVIIMCIGVVLLMMGVVLQMYKTNKISGKTTACDLAIGFGILVLDIRILSWI